MVYVFPAVFQPNGDGYTVFFPDLQGCVTEGSTLEKALFMAKDALTLWLDAAVESGDTVPGASNPNLIKTEKGGFVSLIDVDLAAYRREHDTQPVRRTVSLPNWMDVKARDAGLSLSKVLQDALTERLE